MIALGAAPDADTLLPDFTFVDVAASSLVALLSLKNGENRIFHLLNPNHLGMSDMVGFLNTQHIPVSLLPPERFGQKIHSLMADRSPDDSAVRLLVKSGVFASDRRSPPKPVLCEHTNRILDKLGINWPVVQAHHIERMIHHCREVGFLPAEDYNRDPLCV